VLWPLSDSQDRGNPTDDLAHTPLLAEPNLHHLQILRNHEEDFVVYVTGTVIPVFGSTKLAFIMTRYSN